VTIVAFLLGFGAGILFTIAALVVGMLQSDDDERRRE